MIMRRIRRLLTAGLLIAITVWLVLSGYVAWRFTRRTGAPFAEPAPVVAGAKAESLRLKTCDNEEIGAWLVRGDADKPCILLLHGNGAGRGQMLPVMQWLAETKYTVMAVSFRAHGDSTGSVNDIGWSARHDVVAAVQFLRHNYPERPVFIVGRSLGAAAAVFAAEELKNDVAGYFLEQPYKDLKSAVWNRLQNNLPPVFDWVAYAGLRLWSPVFLPVSPDEISPCRHIEAIPRTVPVTIITGSADRHARLGDVRILAGCVRSGANLVIFKGAQHEALDGNNRDLYRASLIALMVTAKKDSH
jgi:uncharacterized protein